MTPINEQLQRAKIFLGLAKEKEIELNEYAVIAWDSEAEEDNLYGDRFKVIYIFQGENRSSTPFSHAELKLLRNKNIPVYDTTFGLARSLSNFSPLDMAEMKSGLMSYKHGFNVMR